jgi:hypothetical protein
MWQSLFYGCLGGPTRTGGRRGPPGQRETNGEDLGAEGDVGVTSETRDDLYHLHEKILDLSTQLDLERTEYERDSRQTKADVEIRSRQMAEQMRTCLARIDELERANEILREDVAIAARREKGFVGQLAMVQEELERREVEKAALITSLETALSTIYKLKTSS